MSIKLYHQSNIHGKYAVGLYISMIDHKEGHIPLQLIMFTCTGVHHALLHWYTNKGVHLQASNSKTIAERPVRSNQFKYINDGDMTASCSAVSGRQLLTLPCDADTDKILMDTGNHYRTATNRGHKE
jgi:hypothetical protein